MHKQNWKNRVTQDTIRQRLTDFFCQSQVKSFWCSRSLHRRSARFSSHRTKSWKIFCKLQDNLTFGRFSTCLMKSSFELVLVWHVSKDFQIVSSHILWTFLAQWTTVSRKRDPQIYGHLDAFLTTAWAHRRKKIQSILMGLHEKVVASL